MVELSLEWIESGSLRTQRIGLNPITQQVEITRIGRDPSRCDIVLADGSVSGLHVEIGYDPKTPEFYIQNLRESNPPIINGQPLVRGQMKLVHENIIQLGNLQIRANVTGVVSPSPPVIPPTEIQSLGSIPATIPSRPTGSPQYAPPDSPQYYQQSIPLTDPHLYPNTTDSAPVPNHKKSSKSPLFFLILGIILIGLLSLAWPNILGFLGIGASTIGSDSPDKPAQDSGTSNEQLSIADRELFTHPSGLFELEVPRRWTEIDNSRAGQIVIQAWRHPRINAYIIMRVFSVKVALNSNELQLQSQQLVDDLFSELDQFQRAEPEIFNDGTVRVLWEGNQGRETLVATTLVRQDGLNISALTLWAPAEQAENNILAEDVNEIVASWGVDPSQEIP